MSYRRFSGGPLLVTYTEASVHNWWRHVYYSMTENVRSLDDLEGHCFKTLIVGKTSTLNFYQYNVDATTRDHIAARRDAMAVFKAYIRTAQEHAVRDQKARDPASVQFWGYSPPGMELLRRGVGPENIGLVDAIASREAPADVAGMGALEPGWQAEAERLNAPVRDAMLRNAVGAGGGAGVGGVAGTAAGGQAAAVAGQAATAAGTATTGATGAAAVRRAARRLAQAVGSAADLGAAGASTTAAEAATTAAATTTAATTAATTTTAASTATTTNQQTPHVIIEAADEANAADTGDSALADEAEAQRAEAARRAMPSLLKVPGSPREHEPFRPVVTYMCRRFMSRGVLNEVDILRYVLRSYNVTLRVTTFQEPLLEVMELMAHTDVLVGMHGAGWTNALFIKDGASVLQMYPYGWRVAETGAMIRGNNYREIVLASDCPYAEWVSPFPGYAFFRKIDFKKGAPTFVHPGPEQPLPKHGLPGPPWVYQNTYVDIDDFAKSFDDVMAKAGIPKMPVPLATAA